jgi:hypothetical protein
VEQVEQAVVVVGLALPEMLYLETLILVVAAVEVVRLLLGRTLLLAQAAPVLSFSNTQSLFLQ